MSTTTSAAKKRPAYVLGKTPEGEVVGLTRKDRAGHTHVIGGSGKGKSKLLELLIRQDIEDGFAGVCVIDPHGLLYSDLLRYASQHYRHVSKRFVLFEPAGESEHIVGFNPIPANMTEYDPAVLVQTLVAACLKAWKQDDPTSTPRISRWLKNIFHPIVVNRLTLAESYVFLNPYDPDARTIRNNLLEQVEDPLVRGDWMIYDQQPPTRREELMEGAGNRLRNFLESRVIREVIGQEQNVLDFRTAMEEGKVVFINLHDRKGRLSDEGRSLLGILLVNEIYRVAKHRDYNDRNLKPFYLYIDEFGQFVSRDIARALEELRKFKVFLTLAHQFLTQLRLEDDYLYGSVMGNCKNRIVFGGLSPEDAELMTSEIHTGYLNLKTVKDELMGTRITYEEGMIEIVGRTKGNSKGESLTEGQGTSESLTESRASSDTTGRSLTEAKATGRTLGISETAAESEARSRSTGTSEGQSKARSATVGTSDAEGQSLSRSDGTSHSLGGSHAEMESDGSSLGQTMGNSVGTTKSKGHGGSEGWQSAESLGQQRSLTDSHSRQTTWSQSNGGSSSSTHTQGETTSHQLGASSGRTSSEQSSKTWNESGTENWNDGESESVAEAHAKGRTASASRTSQKTLTSGDTSHESISYENELHISERGAASGRAHQDSAAEAEGEQRGESESETTTMTLNRGRTRSRGGSETEGRGGSRGFGLAKNEGTFESEGKAASETHGLTEGSQWGESQGGGESEGRAQSRGESRQQTTGESGGTNWQKGTARQVTTSLSRMETTSHQKAATDGKNWSQGEQHTVSEGASRTHTDQRSETSGTTDSHARQESETVSEAKSLQRGTSASDSVSKSVALARQTSSSSSRSTAEGKGISRSTAKGTNSAESESISVTVVPHDKKREVTFVSSRQFYSLEEVRYLAMARVKTQETGWAFLKKENGPPVQVKVMRIDESYGGQFAEKQETSFREYVVAAHPQQYLRREEARDSVKKRQERIRSKVVEAVVERKEEDPAESQEAKDPFDF